MKKADRRAKPGIVLVLTLILSFTFANGIAVSAPEYYVPGFSILGVLYLFTMFAVVLLIIYTLPHLRDLFKRGL